MERIELETWRAGEVARLLALVENEKHFYQELLAALPYPLAVVSSGLRVLSVNRAFRRFFPDGLDAQLAAGELRSAILAAVAEGNRQTLTAHAGQALVPATIIPFYDQFSDTQRSALLVFEAPTGPANAASDGVPATLWTASAGGSPLPGSGTRPAEIEPSDTLRVRAAFEQAHESGHRTAVDYRGEGGQRWFCDHIRPAGEDRLNVVTTEETERAIATGVWARGQKLNAIARMSGRLAHEFNNILTVITGNADLLLASLSPSSPKRVELQQILSAAERAAEIGNRLRALGRPMRPKPELFDLNEFLRRTTVGTALHLSTEPLFLSADRALLAQALRALAAFAAERLEPGARLAFSTAVRRLTHDHGTLAPGPYVTIDIAPLSRLDEGELERWLEPFGEGASSQAFELTQAAQSLLLMKAHLTIERGAGGEHRIVVLFPQAAKAAPLQPRPIVPAGSRTVMVVDDQDPVRSVMCDLLKRRGLSVLDAASGALALDVARGHRGPIDLLISDVAMSPMRGPELARTMRQLYPGLKTIFVSGSQDDPAFPDELAENEVFLPKPYKSADLLDLVARTLGPA